MERNLGAPVRELGVEFVNLQELIVGVVVEGIVPTFDY